MFRLAASWMEKLNWSCSGPLWAVVSLDQEQLREMRGYQASSPTAQLVHDRAESHWGRGSPWMSHVGMRSFQGPSSASRNSVSLKGPPNLLFTQCAGSLASFAAVIQSSSREKMPKHIRYGAPAFQSTLVTGNMFREYSNLNVVASSRLDKDSLSLRY